MSVEADFGISEWVFQATGSELSWEIAWDGVLDAPVGSQLSASRATSEECNWCASPSGSPPISDLSANAYELTPRSTGRHSGSQ